MPSPERAIIATGPSGILLRKELLDLASGRTFWVALAIMSWLTGYGYAQAVALYADASGSALKSPALARALSPFDGIVVPTFGALYLAATFLFPFIVIRSLSAEKRSGANKLTLQLPYTTSAIIASKLAAAAVAWAAMLFPCLTALIFWRSSGGHVGILETANVILGHFLYATVIIGISLAAASVFDSASSAAVAALGVTLGFWALDFAAADENGLMKQLSGLSLTAVLRSFERGIFSFEAAAGPLIAALGLAALAGIWLHPGRTDGRRASLTVLTALAAGICVGAVTRVPFFLDATEDRRNSFSRPVEEALRAIPGKLAIEVYLAPEDPRLFDMERSILGKLRRAVRNIAIVFPEIGSTPVMRGGDDRYGEVVYRYEAREAVSRSTSEEEVIPLLFDLAGTPPPDFGADSGYPGYPLVATAKGAKMWFYFIMPAVIVLLRLRITRRFRLLVRGRARSSP